MNTFEETKNIKNYKIGLLIIGFFFIVTLFILFLLLNIDSEKTRINRLNRIASNFYSEVYYEQVATNDAERTTTIQGYEDRGLVFTVSDLSKFSNDDIFKEINQECDLKKSKAIIYPKSPYSKVSFDTKVELVCDVKEQAKEANKNESVK